MIRLRAQFQRRGRSLLIAGALALVCVALAWAHSTPESHEMGAMGDDSMADVAAICLGVLEVSGGLLTVVLGGLIVQRSRNRPRSSPAARERIAGVRVASNPPFFARAGPAVLQVLRC